MAILSVGYNTELKIFDAISNIQRGKCRYQDIVDSIAVRKNLSYIDVKECPVILLSKVLRKIK